MQFQCWIAVAITVTFLLDIPHLAKADETFINTPTSVNATLGSRADFRCISRSVTQYWTVDGEPTSWSEVINRSITVSFDPSSQQRVGSTLHILASVENNNSAIVCKAVVQISGSTNSIPTVPAVLKIQGLLDSPTNLQVHATNDSIAVRWSDPFTLNISNMEPDIHTHTVYITNVNTSERWTENVTGTKFIFERKNPDPCHNFTFQVTAWNVVGEGQRSKLVEGFFLGVPCSIHYKQLSVAVLFLPNGTPDVQLKMQMSTCDCQGRRPEFFTIVLQGTYDTRQQVIREEIQFSKQEMSQITLTFPKSVIVTSNELYTVAVIPGNRAGNSAFNIGSIHFSTFDTQDAYVTVINSGNICASCYFAEGTTAQGCLVALGSPMSEELKNLTAFRTNNSAEFCDTLLEPHSIEDTYSCNIYDVEHNAEIGSQPAYSMKRIPVVSPQNITFTDLCGTDEQHNNMSRDEGRIAIYGCAAAGGLAAVMLVVLLVICKCKPLLKRGSDSKSSSKVIHMKPNCAYESVTVTQQSPATDSQN